MRISRLFIPGHCTAHTDRLLDDDSAHYLRTVLRLKKGAELTVFNDTDQEFAATVSEAHRDGVCLKIGPARHRSVESPLTVRLAVGISRGERMDWVIQKAVELGAARISPLFMEHCVVRLDETRRGNRTAHWQKIIQAACEQSGRNRLPQLDSPLTLTDFLHHHRPDNGLYLDPEADTGLSTLPPPQGSLVLLSGPEGGFSPHERQAARAAGYLPVRLGPRILRTETAVVTALAAVQCLWGDLG
jgi:16S rRNA (uracil1498-N3)-methyltransferase